MEKQLKTPEEHFEYVEHLSRISFYFARKYLREYLPDEPLSLLMRDHTPLFYHALNYSDIATKWDNPECQEIMRNAETLAELPPDDFEHEMWQRLAPLARKRAELNYPTAVGVQRPASWNCGSLKYDDPNGRQPEGWCNFHIANAVGPYSIFQDKEYLKLCFLLLIKESSLRFGCHTLTTGTWLNEHRLFLAFFPEEWFENMSPRQEGLVIPPWNFGVWGQLVDSRGMVNPSMERYVRENGSLKYQCRSSHCSFENLKRHLESI